MGFNEIIGQDYVKTVLINSIQNNKIAHAYLFEGVEGIGKKMMANSFADALLCSNPLNGSNCGICDNCIKSKHKTHPDKKIVEGEKSIQIEAIRDVIRDIYIKPYMADNKIYIIEDANKMTVQAQNCILKILEEPPEHSIIILTTKSTRMLLETILSRVIKIKFRPHTKNEIEEYIKSNYNLNKDQIDYLYTLSKGAFGKINELINSDKIKQLKEDSMKVLSSFVKDELSALNTFDIFLNSKDYIDKFLEIILYYLRDILIYKETGKEKKLVNKNDIDTIISISNKMEDIVALKLIEEILLLKNRLNTNANFNSSVNAFIVYCWEVINKRRQVKS